MSNFKFIQAKLQQFIKKYYVNELIKGLLMFFSIGLLYFIFTLLIEYFLWLKPTARTILFVLFILVEVGLLLVYIFIPLVKIWGLKKGINEIEASKIIGDYFPEVSDKLLNMLQLQNTQQNSELIAASIEQKSKELKPIPFKSAIHFSANKKYIKYALIPVLIWLLVFSTGNSTIFNDSFARVVHYKTQYEPPAPFSIHILNNSFNVVEGSDFTLQIETKGDVIPEDAKIYFSNENYYIKNNGFGNFEYTFTNVKKPIEFYIKANKVRSKNYTINLLKTPIITHLKMVLNYPKYTGKSNEVIQNTGNAIVPQGTEITWQIETHQTSNVTFTIDKLKAEKFTKSTTNYFSYSKQLLTSTNYKIATSNTQLKNYETLNFALQVVADAYPKIIVKSDIDSISSGPAQFIGQLSDDFGIKKLQLVYYDKKEPSNTKSLLIEVPKVSFTNFYYVFPEGISIEEGVNYEFYFEVFDNDAINGSKKTASKKFSYYNKTQAEVKETLLNEQNELLKSISTAAEKSKKSTDELNKFKNELQKKAAINWNDTQKLQQFLKRQNQYQEIFNKQVNELDQNLKQQPTPQSLEEKKEALQKRIEEAKKLAEQEKLLDELNKLSEKLEKEDLIKKLQDIAKKNKQNQQSLERILELTKRFYVEQKATQISEKLDELSKNQKELSNKKENENTAEKQNEINKKFEDIKKELEILNKENKDLKRPMSLPNDKDKLDEIDNSLEKALEKLNNKKPSTAKKNQKSAAKKMKQLSKSMEQSMLEMDGEMINENIDDLRKIVENLIEFSFQQEALMLNFSKTDEVHAQFPKNLKQQQTLKEYFEHIDDSLYVLSLRLVKMGAVIQKEVSEVHFNIDKALDNFSDTKIQQGISNQHFVLTSANNLANKLSNLLESLMNASASMGKGKGGEPQFSLPDIIKKQGELTQGMENGMKKGEQPGEEKNGDKKGNKPGENGQGNSEQMNAELFEIYKQQEFLKQTLEEMRGKAKGESKKGFGNAVKQMEELENEMLENGFTKQAVEKMQLLMHELLKLEKATLEQGEDTKRKSETNIQSFEKKNIDKIKLQNQYFNYNEILNRQSLPLRTIYKQKVQEYFKNEY